MIDFRSYFKGKKITVMGLGLLGRGVGDALFLAECGAKLTITDLKTREQLKESLEKLKKFKDIKYVLREHRLEDFQNCDMILKAAGVPLDSPYILEAKITKFL
jgi:UDP-N-acetylmuramoylalanine--D-glutamate ligase